MGILPAFSLPEKEPHALQAATNGGRVVPARDQHGKPLHFAAGNTVIEQGAVDRWMALIVSGEVDVLQGETQLARLDSGKVFGEMAFLSEQPRVATLRATDDLLIWRWEPEWLAAEVDRTGLRAALEALAAKRAEAAS